MSDGRKIAPTGPKSKATLEVKIKHALALAVVEISAEIAEREDVFASFTDAGIARELLAYAVNEHRAGRGPWPKTTR